MSEEIIAATERAIKNLAAQFILAPYDHRCEHSIHCQLFVLLNEERAIKNLKIGLEHNYSTRAVHKEWPEYLKSEYKTERRGNYDLAVIDSGAIPYSLRDFQHGRIRPVAAIEIGLNYCHKHIVKDEKKLNQSGAEKCYIIHFATGQGRQAQVREHVERISKDEADGKLQIVYVNAFRREWRLFGMKSIERIPCS